MSRTIDEYYEMVEEIDNLASNLTNWEINFLESLLSKPGSTISSKQAAIIEELYQRYVINRGITL